jgi:Spy/CpxP family protein refolding chaperone
MMGWWKARRAYHTMGHEGGCGCEVGASAGHGGAESHGHGGRGFEASSDDGFGGEGAFGVRRPLRFLAYKLNLAEAQVSQLARILNDLKTERAQAAVDNRRAVAGLADAIGGEAFNEAAARTAAEARVASAGRLRDAVVKALGEIHAVLQPGQREQLAYLIRTGTLLI